MKENINTSRFSGSTGIALKAGINAAIVHAKLVYYISENFRKKQLWQVTISADKLAEKIPTLNKRQILYAIDKLQDEHLIIVNNWKGHTTGTQKTYTIDITTIDQYYDANRDKIVTPDRDKFGTDHDNFCNDRDKIVTPPLQNCHASNSNTIDYIDNNIDEKIVEEDEEKSLPEIFDFRNPLCSQWKEYLPQFITQKHYDAIREFVKEFDIPTTIEYCAYVKKNYPEAHTNDAFIEALDHQLTMHRHYLRTQKRGW